MIHLLSQRLVQRLCAAVMLCLFTATVSVAQTPTIDEFLSTKSSFQGISIPGFPLERSALTTIQAGQGTVGDFVLFYMQWPADPTEGFFPWDSMKLVDEFGATPVITWEPRYYEVPDDLTSDRPIRYERILSGLYDDFLIRFAKAAKRYGKPFFIRFGHEMNLDEFHWGVEKADFGPESAEVYQKIFRHIVSLFRSVGAANVFWAFCPNNQSVPVPNETTGANLWNIGSEYYPGDEYVDVIGLDGFNWGLSRNLEDHGWTSTWVTFREIFEEAITDLRSVSPTKPIMIFETGTVGDDLGGNKQEWLEDALETAHGSGVDSFNLKGIFWFLADKENLWEIPPQFLATNAQ